MKDSSIDRVVILSPRDALETIRLVRDDVTTTILDPWYNKGVGGRVDNYIPWLSSVIGASDEAMTGFHVHERRMISQNDCDIEDSGRRDARNEENLRLTPEIPSTV
jgi:hypothetical protein